MIIFFCLYILNKKAYLSKEDCYIGIKWNILYNIIKFAIIISYKLI